LGAPGATDGEVPDGTGVSLGAVAVAGGGAGGRFSACQRSHSSSAAKEKMTKRMRRRVSINRKATGQGTGS
jgi:hypothetical protein